MKVSNLETIFMVLLTTDFDGLTTQINSSSMNGLLLKNVMHELGVSIDNLLFKALISSIIDGCFVSLP